MNLKYMQLHFYFLNRGGDIEANVTECSFKSQKTFLNSHFDQNIAMYNLTSAQAQTLADTRLHSDHTVAKKQNSSAFRLNDILSARAVEGGEGTWHIHTHPHLQPLPPERACQERSTLPVHAFGWVGKADLTVMYCNWLQVSKRGARLDQSWVGGRESGTWTARGREMLCRE